MIDIKELQIGNKVKYKDSIVEIAATHLTSHVGILGAFQSMIVSVKCEEIEPIEVTDKLLVKIGFDTDISLIEFYKPINNCLVGIRKDASNSVVEGWHCNIYNNKAETMGDFDFKFLHELQNGIRLVTKGDLEIKL